MGLAGGAFVKNPLANAEDAREAGYHTWFFTYFHPYFTFISLYIENIVRLFVIKCFYIIFYIL